MSSASALIDATTVGLATLLVAAWWFQPSRPSNLEFRLHRLRRQSVAGSVRLPKESAVYRAGSHDVPLVRDLSATPSLGAAAGDQGVSHGDGLWAAVATALQSSAAKSATLGEVGGEQLTFAQAYDRVTCIGSGLCHALDNRPATILDLCMQPSLLSDLTRLACLGFGIHMTVPTEDDPIANLTLGSDPPGAILISARDLARLVDVHLDDAIPIIVVDDLALADKSAKKHLARLVPMSDIENDGVDRPKDPTPVAAGAPWINAFTPADFLAVLGGLAARPANANAASDKTTGAVVIERARTSMSSFVFLLHHLITPPPSSVTLLTAASQLHQPSLLLGLRPHALVLCTPDATQRFTSMLNGFAHTWLEHTASFVARRLAQQHLATSHAHGVLLEWADLLPHQRWALDTYRVGVLGGNLAHVTLLASPVAVGDDDWTWARLGGVRVTRVWGPQALLGCVTRTVPLSVPDSGLAGGVLAHAAVKLVADSEHAAAERVGKVWVSTATGLGQAGKRVSGGWAKTEVVAKIDQAGALRIVQDEQ